MCANNADSVMSVTRAITRDFPQETMTYLVKRGKKYYFRARIPVCIQQYFPSVQKSVYNQSMPKEDFIRSLKTEDFGTAKIRCGELLGKLSALTDFCLNDYVPEDDKINKVIAVLYDGKLEPAKKPRVKGDLRLSDLVQLFINETGREWSPRTKAKIHEFGLLYKFRGDVLLRTLDRDWCREYRDWLLTVPIKATESTFDTMYGNPNLPKITHGTAFDKFSWFRMLIKFGAQEGKIPANFADGLAHKPPKSPRTALTVDEIKTWSSAITFDYKNPERFWVWLLGLFQGGRLNEWCQLYCSDVIKHDDVWCISHNQDKTDKRIKTKEQRIIPIHSKILELHFLEYVEYMHINGHERLFPHLKYTELSGYGEATGGYYSRTLKKLGIEKTYHCLRHSFATQLKFCHAQPLVVKELTGHKFTDITFGYYGENFPIATLSMELEKLQYELDWEHLKIEADKILKL